MFAKSSSKSVFRYRFVSEHVDRYELALIQNPDEAIDAYLPPADSPVFSAVLSELARIRLEWDWKHGRHDGLDVLLNKFDRFVGYPDVLAEVAYEDYRLRSLHGLPRSLLHYRDLYQLDTSNWPSHDQLLCDVGAGESISGNRTSFFSQSSSALGPEGVEATLTNHPARSGSTESMDSSSHAESGKDQLQLLEAGSEFGGFKIIRELGRGTFSRVFLARQSDLAQRSVVLKVTATPMGESQRLARLQHANIMPLYSVHRIDGLFGLCMPFLGTFTLKELLHEIRGQNGFERTSLMPDSGKVIALAINKSAYDSDCPFEECETAVGGRGWLASRYESQSYVEAILSIILRLAEGLAHAHQRGIQHHDIKPANVLMAFDGEPLLMDFNLGRDSGHIISKSRRVVGGTLPYMAPEHLRAMQYAEGEVTTAVDMFSLGVLLYELLTGLLPFDSRAINSHDIESAIARRKLPIRPASDCNASVPPSVNAIVQKCLAPSAADRYASPDELATDIRLHLDHFPNRYANNPSFPERFRKFAKRHPILISNSSMLAIAVVVLGTLSTWFLQTRQEKLSLQAVQTYRDFQESLHQAEAELLFPDGGNCQTGLQLAEQALSIYSTSLAELKDGVEAELQRSNLVNSLPERDRINLSHQLSLLSKLAQSALAEDGLESEPDREEGKASLQEEESQIEPFRRAVDHYHSREYQTALQILEPELDRSPNRFALWFVRGNCFFQLGKYRQAEHAYAMAGWIDRNSALCHLKRAVCYYQLSQDDAALEHLAKAESIAPSIPAIYSNRCLLFERQRSFDKALSEIDRALSLQPDCARFLMMRVRVYRGLERRAEAEADLRRVRGLVPDRPDDWITKGIAVLSESPEEAIECFRRACAWPGSAITARQNISHVLSERLGRTEDAIRELDELLEAYPKFLPALSGRAVLHARLGHADLALQDVKLCLALDPGPETHYQIACVYSLLSKQDTTLRQAALSHLAVSLQPLYRNQLVMSDSDLQPLEDSEAFRSMKIGIQAVLEHRLPYRSIDLESE